jgi:alpha-galactosidase
MTRRGSLASEFSPGQKPCGSPWRTRRGRPRSSWQLAVASAIAIGASAVPAFAQQTEITISMDPPPAEPRINGPRIIGWRPGTPFLHTIAATGNSPLTFAASLPSGLAIDASSGTITGTTPAAGSYPIDITVTNGSGSATATLTLVAGDTLALTPPMGWNSYDSYYGDVTENQVRQAADAMQSILQPFGWNTIVIDYLWYHDDNTIDEYGRFLPDDEKFPNANGPNGFTPIADYVHGLGMKFGIHLMRGIPRNAFAQNTPILGSTYSAQDAASGTDACPWDDHMWGVRGDTEAGQDWYDSIYQQYADWGVDFVKVDDMMNPYSGNFDVHADEVEAVHNALYSTNRSIVFSLSPGPHPTSAVQVLNANANMWRTVNDFWDTNGLSSMDDEFDAAQAWAETDGITPGHWPDADMLPLGDMGHRVSQFTHNQQVTVITLWSIMPSPLMFGGIPDRLPGDDWTIALLTNEEVLAVNQDALGSRGRRVSQQGRTEIWARDLSGGRMAVALFNRGSQDATMTVTLSELGIDGTAAVRDLWRKQDVAAAASEVSANVPWESALMYTVTPPDAGTGGTGGTGGADGTGGITATGGNGGGGTTATGGMIATGGVTATGGLSAGGTGGELATGGAATGGIPATGGISTGGIGPVSTGGAVPGVGGAGTTGGTTAIVGGTPAIGGATASGGTPIGGDQPIGPSQTADDDGGCSCRLGSRPDFSWWGLLALASALLARARRR